jgi:hypothetical protein
VMRDEIMHINNEILLLDHQLGALLGAGYLEKKALAGETFGDNDMRLDAQLVRCVDTHNSNYNSFMSIQDGTEPPTTSLEQVKIFWHDLNSVAIQLNVDDSHNVSDRCEQILLDVIEGFKRSIRRKLRALKFPSDVAERYETYRRDISGRSVYWDVWIRENLPAAVTFGR